MRNGSIDSVKVIACILVVVLHTVNPGAGL